MELTKVSSENNLLIVGAGQYGHVAREIAESMKCFDKISFLDDRNPWAVGKSDQYNEFTEEYRNAIVAIGNTEVRNELTVKLRNAGYMIATLISPLAYVSPSAVVSEGCVVEPMTVINTESVINECCFISAGAVINHNSVIGKGCHIDCSATVKSNAKVEAGTKIECGRVIA